MFRLILALLIATGAPAAAAAEELGQVVAFNKAGEHSRAAQLARQALAGTLAPADEQAMRIELAIAFLGLDRKGRACNELQRAKRLDAQGYARREGADLETRACGGLAPVSLATPATSHPPDAAQVFVIPRFIAGPRQLWKSLAEAGADMVFIRAFHRKGDRYHEEVPTTLVEGVYFANDHVPVIEDRLAFDCEAARAQGLRCHAWMTTRATAIPKLKGAAHRDVEWNFRTRQFETIDGLDPFDPKVERVLEDLWRSLARAGVDGVLLQDDLMMRQLEGFSKHARKAWKRRTGRALVPEELVTVTGEGQAARVKYEEAFWDFAAMKRDRLLDLAESLQAAAREINPKFETSINLYYETVTNPPMGLAWTSQELEASAARDFKRLAVMAYHRQIEQEMGVLERSDLWSGFEKMAARLATVPGAQERVLVKLQSIDWKDRSTVPPAELSQAAAPFRGFSLCLAPADDLQVVPKQLRALRGGAP